MTSAPLALSPAEAAPAAHASPRRARTRTQPGFRLPDQQAGAAGMPRTAAPPAGEGATPEKAPACKAPTEESSAEKSSGQPALALLLAPPPAADQPMPQPSGQPKDAPATTFPREDARAAAASTPALAETRPAQPEPPAAAPRTAPPSAEDRPARAAAVAAADGAKDRPAPTEPRTPETASPPQQAPAAAAAPSTAQASAQPGRPLHPPHPAGLPTPATARAQPRSSADQGAGGAPADGRQSARAAATAPQLPPFRLDAPQLPAAAEQAPESRAANPAEPSPGAGQAEAQPAADIRVDFVRADAIDVTIAAGSAELRDRIRAARDELRDDLARIGTEVEALHVELRGEPAALSETGDGRPGGDNDAQSDQGKAPDTQDLHSPDQSGRGSRQMNADARGSGGGSGDAAARAEQLRLSTGPAAAPAAAGPTDTARRIDRYA